MEMSTVAAASPHTAETICGPVEISALGHVQPHEHLYVEQTPAGRQNPALCIDSCERSREELMLYRETGGTTLLDAQPLGAGRNAAALHRIAADTGCHVIAVTGYHLAAFYQPDASCLTGDADVLTRRYLADLDSGMDGTSYRAGAVKAAIPEAGAVDRYKTLLTAAATAAAERNVPLLLHTERGQNAIPAIRLMEHVGLKPAKMLICHADRQAEDYFIHEAIADTGAYLEYDTIGRFRYHSDEAEIQLIRHMIKCGAKKQLLLSLDTTAARLLSYGGTIGLSYLLKIFLPALQQAGVSQDTLNIITRTNPQRVFQGD